MDRRLNYPQAMATPPRAQIYGRRPEELHIPVTKSTNQQGPRETSRQHSYHSSQDHQTPGITVHQVTPQSSHYSNQPAGPALPNALQPGRPSALSSITAPSTVPTLPQIQNPTQHLPSSSRPSTASTTHGYSRSSPAGMDQPKYVPFLSTPENSKFSTPQNHRYTASQSNQSDSVFSPLGLADIRPLGDLDVPQSANPYSNDGLPAFPTNSNYIAPYAIYAFDWCKWPMQKQGPGDSAGKMAIGSYVEDGHNFVCV